MTGQKRLITLRDILYTFFKNKVVISVVLLVAVLGALIYCAVTPARYRAEAKILVKMGKAQISGMQQFPPEQFNMLFQERTQNIRNEMELLKGEYITEKVVERLRDQIRAQESHKTLIEKAKDAIRNALYQTGLMKRPSSLDKEMVGVFMDSLGVTYLEDTDMIKLTFDWTDPRFAALVANTYSDEYVTQHTRVYETQRSYRFYIDQIELFEKKLQAAEDELQGFISRSNLANIELQKEILLRNIGDLNNRLNLVMVDSAQARTKLSKIKDMARMTGAWVETPDIGSAMLDKQAYLRTLDDSYFKLKVERERLLKNYTPAANEIKAIDLQLNNLRNQKAESLTNIVNMELALAENKKNSLQREIGEETKKLENVTAKTITLKQLQRARDLIEANYQVYKKKAEDLRISDDLDARRISSVKIATPAIPPLAPAYPRKKLIIGMAAFLGLFFGFGFSAVREFFDHTFKDEENVMAQLGVPLLLSVPVDAGTERRGGLPDWSYLGNTIRGKLGMGFSRPTPQGGGMPMQRSGRGWLGVVSLMVMGFCAYLSLTGGIPDSAERVAAGERYLAQVAKTPASPSAEPGELTTVNQGAASDQANTATKTTPGAAQSGAPVQTAAELPAAKGVDGATAPATESGKAVSQATQKAKPAMTEHVVSRGETLVSILKNTYRIPDAQIFNESIDLMKAANPGLNATTALKVGQKILVPEEVVQKGKAAQGRSVKGS